MMLPVIYMSMLEDSGDRLLFEELYEKYRSRMFGIAYAVLRNEADAEDAVSESFLKIAASFSAVSKLESKKREGYIVILCRNTALDIYRRNKREAEHTAGDIDETDISFEQEEPGRLSEALKKLPVQHRDIIYLYCIFGCSAEEGAKRLGISRGAFYTRLSRAKAELKKLLEEGESDE